MQSQTTKHDKQQNRVPTKKWKEQEELLILQFLKNTVQENKEIEKPTAKLFYTKMIQDLQLSANTTQVKTKVNQFKKAFNKALEWEKQTGQGVEEGTIKDYVSNICPHYEILSEILGNKANIDPPYIFDSCTDNFDDVIEVEENLLENDNDSPFRYNVYSRNYSSDDSIENCSIIEKSADGGLINDPIELGLNNDETESSQTQKNSDPKKKTGDDAHTVKKFKKYLSSSSSKKRNRSTNSASDFLSELQTKRFESMEKKNEIEKLRLDSETKLKESELQLAREKFEFEKQLKLKEIEKKYDTELEIKIKEIESREKIEIMKIQMTLALAKKDPEKRPNDLSPEA